MTLNEYQELALRTAKSCDSFERKITNFGLGISGEAGEVSDIIKKSVFHGHELDYTKIKKELGDVLWYIATIADVLHITLDEVAEVNIAKLKERYPEGFSVEASINRKEDIDES